MYEKYTLLDACISSAGFCNVMTDIINHGHTPDRAIVKQLVCLLNVFI